MAIGGSTGHMGTSKCDDDGALGREMKRSAITGPSALLLYKLRTPLLQSMGIPVRAVDLPVWICL